MFLWIYSIMLYECMTVRAQRVVARWWSYLHYLCMWSVYFSSTPLESLIDSCSLVGFGFDFIDTSLPTGYGVFCFVIKNWPIVWILEHYWFAKTKGQGIFYNKVHEFWELLYQAKKERANIDSVLHNFNSQSGHTIIPLFF